MALAIISSYLLSQMSSACKDILKKVKENWITALVFLFSAFSFIALYTPGKVDTASIPNVITYQGKLLEDNSAATTTKAMGFLIYDSLSGGSLVYTASGTVGTTSTLSVTPSQGIFSVDLGSSGTNVLTTSTFASNRTLYLEVWVDGTKLTPRKQLTAAPYAINSEYLLGITATSTSSSTYIPHSDSNGNFTFTGTPQSSGVGGGIIYVNPGSADNNETLFGLAVAGTEKFRVDEDGDVWMSGSAWINGALSVTSTLTVVATSTLSTTTISGDFNVDSGTLYVDQINNYVGISSSSPSFPLSVLGQSYFSATSTIQDLTVLDGIVLGGVKRNSWPGGGGGGDVTAAGDNTFTGLNTFSATTTFSSTTINALLNVGSGLLYVDAINNKVGINSSTPIATLGIDGTAHITGTTTIDNLLQVNGKSLNAVRVGGLIDNGSVFPFTGSNDIKVVGDIAYTIASVDDALTIINVASSSDPVIISTIIHGGSVKMDSPSALTIEGEYAFVGSSNSDAFEIIDISDKGNPSHVASLSHTAGGPLLQNPSDIAIAGNYAYVLSSSDDTLNIINISNPRDPRYVTKLEIFSSPRDIAIQGRYGYISNATGDTISVIDISNPVSPSLLSTFSSPFLTGPQKIALQGSFMYVSGSGSNSINIIDISNPNTLKHVGRVVDAGVLTSPDDIAISGDFVYVNNGSTVSIIDVSNKSAPRIVGEINTGGIANGAEGITVVGNYLYTLYNDFFVDGFGIFDISGTKISQAEIGSAKINSLETNGDVRLNGNVSVKGGLNVGSNGAAISGPLSLTNNSASLYTTNTINFSHTSLFKSYASSTASNLFIFDTANPYTLTASTTYILSVRNNDMKLFSVASNGDAAVSGTIFANSATIGTPGSPGDLAERVDIAVDDMVEPGDVVIVDPDNTDSYRRSRGAYEQSVAGVISTNPTLVIGYGQTEHTAVMAMVGRVPIKVTTQNGPIRRGDILVTASSTGYAMRYDANQDDDTNVVGIIGVALESLGEGEGRVMGLVRTGWVNSRHQTIADIQQELLELAEAQAAGQVEAQALNVQDQNGQITFLSDDLNARGFSILNIGRLVGNNDRWEVDSEGRFVTKINTSQGKKSLYSVQSGETEYVFYGNSQLNNGEIRIDFDDVTKEIIDGEKPLKINITLTSEARGVYVSQKDGTGFTVKELQGGTSNATFDWVVIAVRRPKDQEQQPQQAPVQNDQPVQEEQNNEVNENPPAEVAPEPEQNNAEEQNNEAQPEQAAEEQPAQQEAPAEQPAEQIAEPVAEAPAVEAPPDAPPVQEAAPEAAPQE